MQPVLIDTTRVLPLPQHMKGIICSNCDKPLAVWEFKPDDTEALGSLLLCSFCLLYKSFWGQNRREQIDHFISEVEKKMGVGMIRDDENRLVFSKDCDRIMGAIALASKLFQAMDARDAKSVGTKEEKD